jgi:conjugal transfer pilus assembly protein TraE
MNPEAYKDELSTAKKAVRDHRLATTLIGAALVFALAIIHRQVDSARTIITPPVIDRTFWVSGSKVSNEYLELMGPFIAQMILDISPSSVQYKRDTLLKFVRPESHSGMRIQMDKEGERLGKLGASTVFRIARVTPNAESKSVRMDGTLSTYINSKEFNTDASYDAQFTYDGGSLWLISFEAVGKAP